MHATITGMGQWLPEMIRENNAWPAEFGSATTSAQGRELTQIDGAHEDRYQEILFRLAATDEGDPFRGTLRRRVADDAMTSSEAEALAAKAALADAEVDPADVDFILESALVPDRLSPSNAPKVAYLIGASRAMAINVEAACASVVAQISVAASLIESGRARNVLLTQSHVVARANPMSHAASPMLGDAATALVMSASERPGLVDTKMGTDGSFYDAVTWSRGRDHDPPWWREGGPFTPGTRNPAQTKQLGRLWVRMAAETIEDLLRTTQTPVQSIDVIASVQPRRWLPRAICEAFELPAGLAPDTHADLAHIGTCGVVANLLEARRRGMLRPGANVVLFAMGAGVTRAAALLKWS